MWGVSPNTPGPWEPMYRPHQMGHQPSREKGTSATPTLPSKPGHLRVGAQSVKPVTVSESTGKLPPPQEKRSKLWSPCRRWSCKASLWNSSSFLSPVAASRKPSPSALITCYLALTLTSLGIGPFSSRDMYGVCVSVKCGCTLQFSWATRKLRTPGCGADGTKVPVVRVWPILRCEARRLTARQACLWASLCASGLAITPARKETPQLSLLFYLPPL